MIKRLLVFFVVALAFAVHTMYSQQNKTAHGGLHFARFVAPEYLPFARQGALQGTLRVRISADSNGSVSKIEILDGNQYLQDFVTHAVRQWQFYPCEAQPCEAVFVFKFRLEGERTSYWTPTRIIIDPPYTVEIITNPPLPVDDYMVKPKK